MIIYHIHGISYSWFGYVIGWKDKHCAKTCRIVNIHVF
jgi:hypothetical protein